MTHASSACPIPAVTYAGDGGLQAGNEAAAVMLPLYRPTFVSPIDPFIGGTEPGEWRPTPNVTAAANTFMAYTEPFTLKSTRQFRPQPPPPMVSEIYTREYNEVKSLGKLTGSSRTVEQTDLALFWFANPISTWFATLRGIAMANHHRRGRHRPAVCACRNGCRRRADDRLRDEGSLQLLAADHGDPAWRRRWQSRHRWGPGLDAAHADSAVRRSFVRCELPRILDPRAPLNWCSGTDDVNFSITSSIAGLTTNPRPYNSLSSALDDIVDVRILQGIHFRSADIEGRRQGARVAHWAYQRFLRPLPGTR